MATIRKRGDSYQIIVSCGYDSNHKQILKRKTYRPELLTKKGKPRTAEAIAADVKKAAADFEARVLHGEAVAGDNMTFEVLAQKYLQECAERTQAPTTLKSTKTAVDQFIDDFGYIKVSNITPMFLQEYVNGLLDAKRQDKRTGTISPKTVKRKIAVLSAIFSQAIKWDIVKYNPVRAVSISEKEKPTETDIQCFTQQQAVSFLQALDNPMMYEYTQHNRTAKTGNVTQIRSYQAEHTLNNQLKLFLNLAIYAGCRRGELIALTWQDIDFGTDTIHINKSTCRVNGQIITKTPKTKGSIRSINIPSSVSALAKAWKKEQMEYRFMIGTQWKGGNMDRCNVFIQWDGSQMGLETPYQAFKRIIANYNDHCKNESEKLPDIPLHGLRHTSATLLISSRKMDVMTVSKRLGHNNTSTTLNIYAHAYEELDKKAASTLDNLLSNDGQLSL